MLSNTYLYIFQSWLNEVHGHVYMCRGILEGLNIKFVSASYYPYKDVPVQGKLIVESNNL